MKPPAPCFCHWYAPLTVVFRPEGPMDGSYRGR
jgi:hypothetical protein